MIRWAVAVSVMAALAGGVGCGDGDDGDRAAFCGAVASLKADDPFDDLLVATPEEMQAAFGELDDGVDLIVDDAPPDAEAQADAYRDSVDGLLDQLRGAGFDLRRLDRVAYRRTTADYQAAAISLENTAESLCS